MKKSVLVTIGFILIIVLSFAQAIHLSYNQLYILNDAKGIIDVEYPMESVASELRHHNMVRTKEVYGTMHHISRNETNAHIGHKAEYISSRENLKNEFRKFEALLTQSDRPSELRTKTYTILEELKFTLDSMQIEEDLAFKAMEEGDVDRASALVHSAIYKENRTLFYNKVDELIDVEHQYTVALSDNVVDRSVEMAQVSFLIGFLALFIIIINLLLIRTMLTKNTDKVQDETPQKKAKK